MVINKKYGKDASEMAKELGPGLCPATLWDGPLKKIFFFRWIHVFMFLMVLICLKWLVEVDIFLVPKSINMD